MRRPTDCPLVTARAPVLLLVNSSSGWRGRRSLKTGSRSGDVSAGQVRVNNLSSGDRRRRNTQQDAQADRQTDARTDRRLTTTRRLTLHNNASAHSGGASQPPRWSPTQEEITGGRDGRASDGRRTIASTIVIRFSASG